MHHIVLLKCFLFACVLSGDTELSIQQNNLCALWCISSIGHTLHSVSYPCRSSPYMIFAVLLKPVRNINILWTCSVWNYENTKICFICATSNQSVSVLVVCDATERSRKLLHLFCLSVLHASTTQTTQTLHSTYVECVHLYCAWVVW